MNLQRASRRHSYMSVTDVNRFVDDDPRDRFLATGLRQRALVRHVVISGR